MRVSQSVRISHWASDRFLCEPFESSRLSERPDLRILLLEAGERCVNVV